MVRLTHLSGSLTGTSSSSPKAVIRIGRGADCDIRFDAQRDTRVSAHHAEIRFDSGHYVLVDTGSSNGTLVNGKMVKQQKLRSGDRLVFGARGGPEVRFEIDDSIIARPSMVANGGARSQSHYGQPLQQPSFAQPPIARKPPPRLAPDKDAAAMAVEAQQKIAMARAMSGGESSGQTMFIMADSLKQVEATTERKTGKHWKKIVLSVLVVAAVGFAAMGAVIWQQKQQIEPITKKKESAD